MKKSNYFFISLVLAAWLLPGVWTSAIAGGMDLAGLLVNKLGVTQAQAEGGAGSIFNVAKGALSADDFSKVTNALPEASKLMQAAPTSGVAQAASAAVGNKAGSLGNLASLAGSFSQLGMKGNMVSQFIPIVLDYATSKGGSGVGGLLQSVLK